MTEQKNETYGGDAKNTTATGSSEARGDGTVSDEDMDAISGGKKHRKTGQDHSLENYEDSEPTSGVGAFQDSSLIKENVAHIADDEE